MGPSHALLVQSSDRPPTSLTVVQGESVIVHLGGEYDCSTSSTLTHILSGPVALGATRIVVDLSAVDFMDSATMRVLLDAVEALAGESCTLALRDPTPLARRLLHLCGAADLIEDTAGLATAVRSPGQHRGTHG